MPNQIAQIEILEGQLDPKVKYEKHEFKLTFSNNMNNIGVMDTAELVGHYYAGKNKTMFNKGDLETKVIQLKTRVSSYALAPKMRKDLSDMEDKMTYEDE